MRSVTSGRVLTLLMATLTPVLMLSGGCSSDSARNESELPEMEGPSEPQGSGVATAPDWSVSQPSVAASSSGTAMPESSGSGRVGDFQDPNALVDLAARQQAIQQRKAVLTANYLQIGAGHEAAGRLQDALRAYEGALSISPDNAEARTRYDAVASVLGVRDRSFTAQGRDNWSTIQQRLQQAELFAREHVRKGHQLAEANNYEGALDEYRKALTILDANPSVDAEFDRAQVRGALADAEARLEARRRDDEARRLREVEDINRSTDQKEREKVARRVQDLMDRAVQSFERERFSDAENLAGEVLRLDFSNRGAAKLKEAARLARHAKANADNISDYRTQWQRALQEVKDIAMPITTTVTYPSLEVWNRIAAKGPITLNRASTAVNEIDAEVQRRLEARVFPTVDWSDKTLDDVVRFIRNDTGTNILITRAVDEVAPVDGRLLPSLTLVNISAFDALKNAINQLSLAWVIKDGIFQITTKEQARQNKILDFYEVRDLTAPIRNFPGQDISLNPSEFDPGSSGFDDSDSDGEGNSAIPSDQLMDLIRTTVDPVSWEEDADNRLEDKNGTLIIRQTPENHRAIRRLLSDLRQNTGVQVQIEARFISVENNFLQEIGVDFRGLGDNSGGLGQGGLGTAAPFDDFGINGPNLQIGSDNSSGALYSLGGGNGDIRGRTQNLFDVALGNPEVLTGTGGFSLQYTYLDDTELEAILRAVQKYERVNEVTAPSLLVANTQRASLQVANQIAYVRDFDVEIAQASVVADPVVDLIKEGVVLDVRPIVSHDRKFITLELRPTVATLKRPVRTFTTTLGTGSAVTFEVPELKKQSLKTTVVMPDGGTLLLGGLKYYEEQDLDAGVPILKDIPVLSFFFSRKGKYTNLRDLLVLVQAKVIIISEYAPK